MKEMRILVFLIAHVFSTPIFAQDQYQEQHKDGKFNLPPGYSIPPKKDTKLDYSVGISKMPAVAPADFVPGDFLMAFGLPTIREKMAASPEFNAYCRQAENFYNQLSNRVRSTYSMEELWYIYMYDPKLAQQLTTFTDDQK